MLRSNKIIVTRHKAVIDFLAKKGIAGEIITGNATPDDVKGRDVYGNIPLHLAKHARIVHAIEFTGDPPRGTEYSVDDMIKAGAKIVPYKIMTFEKYELFRNSCGDE